MCRAQCVVLQWVLMRDVHHSEEKHDPNILVTIIIVVQRPHRGTRGNVLWHRWWDFLYDFSQDLLDCNASLSKKKVCQDAPSVP